MPLVRAYIALGSNLGDRLGQNAVCAQGFSSR